MISMEDERVEPRARRPRMRATYVLSRLEIGLEIAVRNVHRYTLIERLAGAYPTKPREDLQVGECEIKEYFTKMIYIVIPYQPLKL